MGTFRLVDVFLWTTVIALILAFSMRHAIPAVVVTLGILGIASFSIGNRRLTAAVRRHPYRVMFIVVALYLFPWLFLTVGF